MTAVALDTGSPEATAAEVTHLWRFLDGTMMNPETRRYLHRAQGFCPRHTWLHAAVELELRGGRPFGTSILYEDLTRRASRATESVVPARLLVGRLRARARCLTCEYIRTAPAAADDLRLKGSFAKVKRLEVTRRRLESVRDEWEARSCPLCAGGEGIVCRQHLLRGADVPAGLADDLGELADRLGALVGSMTWQGEPVGPYEEASWVEALGWFAGWDFPAKALG